MNKTVEKLRAYKSKSSPSVIVGVIFSAIIGSVLAVFLTAVLNGTLPLSSFPPPKAIHSTTAAIAQKAAKGTVSIVGTKEGEKIAGSGFVVSKKGYIVTCAHVVSDPTARYTVIGANQQSHPVRIIYQNASDDLAVLQVEDGTTLPPLTLGNSNTLHEGDEVIAIGNPFGLLSETITTGVVSGTHRDIVAQSPDTEDAEGLDNVIQIDAPLNPGESGGPILNSAGEVIGVSAASDTRAQNISFAIPINTVKKMLLLQT